MITKQQRPLIDRPRYISKPPKLVNTETNNKSINENPINKPRQKRKVVNDEMLKERKQKNLLQQPISGSVNQTDEGVKDTKSPIKSKPPRKRKTEKPHKPSSRPTKSKKDEGGVFRQMKDKFIGKPNKEDTKDN